VLKHDTKLGGITPRFFSATYREKIDKLQMICRKLHILSNSANFSADRPLLPAYNFAPQSPLSISFIVWGYGLPKISGD